MLEPKDLQQIGEELGKVIEQNITPQLDELHHDLGVVKEDLGVVKEDLGVVNGKVDSLERKVDRIEADMVTKAYLDDKLADLEGGLIARLRKEDTKVNRLVDILKNKKVLTEQEVRQLAELHVFPKAS